MTQAFNEAEIVNARIDEAGSGSELNVVTHNEGLKKDEDRQVTTGFSSEDRRCQKLVAKLDECMRVINALEARSTCSNGVFKGTIRT